MMRERPTSRRARRTQTVRISWPRRPRARIDVRFQAARLIVKAPQLRMHSLLGDSLPFSTRNRVLLSAGGALGLGHPPAERAGILAPAQSREGVPGFPGRRRWETHRPLACKPDPRCVLKLPWSVSPDNRPRNTVSASQPQSGSQYGSSRP